MNELKKIIILDYTQAKVLVYTYDENLYRDPEDFFNSMGLKIKDCEYIIVRELNIEIK